MPSPTYCYLHISILLILDPLSLHLLSHTHTHTSIITLQHSLHISSAAVLSMSPVLLPNIHSVFLRASQEMSFIKLERHAQTYTCTQTHTENPKHPEETKWGQTSVQPDTHTHFFWKNNTTAATPLPRLPAIGNGNFRISGSGAIRIPYRAPKQCSYSCSRATNIIRPLIRPLKQPSLAHKGFVTGSWRKLPTENEKIKRCVAQRKCFFTHRLCV